MKNETAEITNGQLIRSVLMMVGYYLTDAGQGEAQAKEDAAAARAWLLESIEALHPTDLWSLALVAAVLVREPPAD